MKLRIALYLLALFAGFILVIGDTSAQTIAYRQTNLASDLPNVANNVTQGLVNPWGISFLPGQPFFIANNNGRVISQDASGAFAAPGGFIILNPAENGPGSFPAGIVADANSFFGGGNLVQPFITVTELGGIYLWGLDANGDIPTAATSVVDQSRSDAV